MSDTYTVSLNKCTCSDANGWDCDYHVALDEIAFARWIDTFYAPVVELNWVPDGVELFGPLIVPARIVFILA